MINGTRIGDLWGQEVSAVYILNPTKMYLNINTHHNRIVYIKYATLKIS